MSTDRTPPGRPDRTPPGQRTPEQEAAQKKLRRGGSLGCLALVVLAFAGCSALVSIGRNADSSETDLLVYQSTAQDVCQGLVKKQLKAPSTATFTDTSNGGTSEALTAEGTVNSENSFGAMLASSYSCTGYVDADETVRVQLVTLN